jgi:rhodanese-related sulfurtransferase
MKNARRRTIPLLAAALLVASPLSAAQSPPQQEPAAEIAPVDPRAEIAKIEAARPPFGFTVVRRVTADEMRFYLDAGERVYFVDNRSVFSGPMVKGASHIPLGKLAEWSKTVPKDAMIVAYCTCSAEQTSSQAVLRLQSLGFTRAFALRGGLTAWRAAGLPVDEPRSITR